MKTSKTFLLVLAFFLVGFNIASAHNVTTSCESITLSNAPANSTAVLTPRNIHVPGNGTFSVPADTYTVTWSDNVIVKDKVVPACPSSKPTPPPASKSSASSTPPASSTSKQTSTPPPASTASTQGTSSTSVAPTGSGSLVTSAPSENNTTQGTLSVTETVINDNGGKKTFANFSSFVNNTLVTEGVANILSAPNSYTVTESSDPYYTESFSGDCDTSGQVNLSGGDNKFCVVTKDDIGAPSVKEFVPPLISLTKVPTPSVLPNGPGQVIYTYTLRNIGTVPVNQLVISGDPCSPITLLSGDNNKDGTLDTNETWIYGCYATLSATTTESALATGWANGFSAADLASATVIVGAPTIPPAIQVTQMPTPSNLPLAGVMVTYTDIVTNPGTVALTAVSIKDNLCNSTTFISGDTNGDGKLDPTESWVYICQMFVSKNTNNTAIAEGASGGLVARDLGISNVLLHIPHFPNTGFPPQREEISLTDTSTLDAPLPTLIKRVYNIVTKVLLLKS